MPQNRLTIQTLLQPMERGSTQPWLVQGSDEKNWLVKWAGAGPGPGALLAEFITNRIAVAWGFPVPAVRPIFLDAEIQRAGTDEFWDILDQSQGWNLAVFYLPGVREVSLLKGFKLPDKSIRRILLLDLLFANYDRTLANPNLLEDPENRIWMIDHESCRFLSKFESPVLEFALAPNHFLYEGNPRELLAGVTSPVYGESELNKLLEDIPEPWLEVAGLNRSRMIRSLTKRIGNFSLWLKG